MEKRCTICNKEIEVQAILDSNGDEYICRNEGCIKVYVETLHWKDVYNALRAAGYLEDEPIN